MTRQSGGILDVYHACGGVSIGCPANGVSYNERRAAPVRGGSVQHGPGSAVSAASFVGPSEAGSVVVTVSASGGPASAGLREAARASEIGAFAVARTAEGARGRSAARRAAGFLQRPKVGLHIGESVVFGRAPAGTTVPSSPAETTARWAAGAPFTGSSAFSGARPGSIVSFVTGPSLFYLRRGYAPDHDAAVAGEALAVCVD